MFTGIVRSVGKILDLDQKSEALGPGILLRIRAKVKKVVRGESISIEGICLTVIGAKKSGKETELHFEASQETLEKSSLKFLSPGMEVNVEPSLKVGDKLGGHFVQGHVDGVGKITRMIPQGNSKLYWFQYPPSLDPYLVSKGSVAVNGVSLTVVEISNHQFSASLLPYTEEATSFRARKTGDPVNLEGDILAKVVAKQMESLKEKSKGMELYQKKITTWEEISGEII